MFPPILVLMIIFNGFNIAEESTPKPLRWIPKASFIRWCSEGLAVNEFRGLTFTADKGHRGPVCNTGEEALARVSFDKSTVRRANMAQAGIIGCCYAATYGVLLNNKPRYLSIAAARPSVSSLAPSKKS